MNRVAKADLVAATKDACLEAARRAYEEASMQGLCEQGRIEMVLDAIGDVKPAEVAMRVSHKAGGKSSVR